MLQAFLIAAPGLIEEIGLKTTGNGLLAITNWHWLSEAEEKLEPEIETGFSGAHPRRVSVRMVNVFGFEAEASMVVEVG